MTHHATPSSPWRKSSYSDTAQQCVEIAQTGSACLVLDTKDRAAGHLVFSSSAWAAFTSGIRKGHLPMGSGS